MESQPTQPPRPHVWPWFVLAALVLGAVLAVLGITAEARRTRERRQYYLPPGETNAPAAGTNASAPPSR